MDSSSKDGSCYIDGVPLKISPKFYPPRPVSLPLPLDTKTASDLLAEQYDFSLERSVIDLVQKRRSELLETTAAKEKPADLPKPGSLAPVPPWQSSSILQPKPVDRPPSPRTLQDVTKINLSDFENDTSSPFDDMELQTLNELEELNSVFQGIRKESPTKSIPSSLSEDLSSITCSRDLSCDTAPGCSQVPYVAPLPTLRGCKSYSDIRSLPDVETPCVAQKERSRTPPTCHPDTSQVQALPLNKESFERESMPEPSNGVSMCAYEEMSVKHLGMEEKEEQALPLNEEYFGRELMPQEPSNGVSTCAYEELDDAEKHFVDSITEMGFVKGQVARAVKHLGMDEKKVVEHLCQIQMLEESGYESSEAEAALHLHDYNRDQAKAFLDLVIRFQDLGFEKDAVKKALVQNKNDWNKTIDALLP